VLARRGKIFQSSRATFAARGIALAGM